MKFNKIILISIILLFLCTRLYKITEIPGSLYWDEASIGYNAYSILTTGKDEWGRFLPVHFRAFGEFKLPVYIYTVSVFESVFGLNELAVRLPAVMYSLGVLLLVYLLSNRFFNNKYIGLYSAFFLVITPWFFIFSRTGYEATAGLFFYLLGIYLLLRDDQQKLNIYLGFLSFIINLYSYNSFRIITPLTILILVPYLFKTWKQSKKSLAIALVVNFCILAIFSLPIIRLTASVDGLNRLNNVGVFSKFNDPQILATNIIKNYFSHFTPEFLFVNGDSNLRSGIGEFGELYWAQLPLLLISIVYIFRSRRNLQLILILLLVIAPIPAAITIESPHSLRTISAVPFIAILSGYGLYLVMAKLKKSIIINCIILGTFLIFFSYFIFIYLNEYFDKSSAQWQYGYKKIFVEYKGEFIHYDNVLVSDYMGQPYIFYIFYTQYDPNKQIKERLLNPVNSWGFSTIKGYNNVTFMPITIDSIPKGKTIIFASPFAKLDGIVNRGVVRSPKGDTLFYVYDFEK